jgi:hypothetical protein
MKSSEMLGNGIIDDSTYTGVSESVFTRHKSNKKMESGINTEELPNKTIDAKVQDGHKTLGQLLSLLKQRKNEAY